MIISRCYTVMDSLVVEVTCVHSGDPSASHLLIREERRPRGEGMVLALKALAEVHEIAASLVAAGHEITAGPRMDDCASF